MPKSVILSTGRVTSADDIVTVTLTEPLDAPPAIFIRWPYQPSVTTPDRLPAIANAIMAVLAEAIAKLAQIRAEEQ
jgi:hypothetical protein